jgi:flagellar biosynthesis anti-sigma factor FlgM
MKPVNINGLNSTQQARLQQPESVRPKDAESLSPAHIAPDQVSVSSRAEEIGRLIARAGELAYIRQGRVDSLREVLQYNQYKVSSSNIADAIMRDEAAA